MDISSPLDRFLAVVLLLKWTMEPKLGALSTFLPPNVHANPRAWPIHSCWGLLLGLASWACACDISPAFGLRPCVIPAWAGMCDVVSSPNPKAGPFGLTFLSYHGSLSKKMYLCIGSAMV
jgi:hypothetical protein